ncbi:MAG TPA: hypothetical protein PK950_03355 [Candidatus Paceibacterota bacterium]|nr:hypothetical protein [Candidatus Paceibacterota bacterium]
MALDLILLGKKLDDALSKETPQSLREWLEKKRKKQRKSIK